MKSEHIYSLFILCRASFLTLFFVFSLLQADGFPSVRLCPMVASPLFDSSGCRLRLNSREPSPTTGNTGLKIGDVGFIRSGRFHLLFSAGLPLGERTLGIDVPRTFVPLDVGELDETTPRDPGYRVAQTCPGGVISAGELAVPISQCVASL